MSEETLAGGLKVNELRQKKGLSILDIHPISLIDDSYASANEENKISSSSFRKRLLGTHLKPSKVINYARLLMSFWTTFFSRALWSHT